MRKTFLSHLFLVVLLNLLVKPLAIFGIDAQVQNEVGAAEYGFYFSLLNFTYLFNILLDFGISNFNIKYMAQYPHLARNYIGKILPLRLILFVIYLAFSLILAFSFGYNEKQFQVLYILLFNQFIISVILYLRSYFSGLLYLKIDILLSVLDKLLLIFLVGYFIYFDHSKAITITEFVLYQTITLFLTLILALILLVLKIGLPIIKWHWSFCWLILKKSFPYALLIVLMMLYNRVDSVMIERVMQNGKYQAGIFAQAFRLLDAFFMFAMLFSNLLFPLFSKLIQNKSETKLLLFTASNILIPGAFILAACCFVDWEFLMNLFYENQVHDSGKVFQILMLSFIPMCLSLLFGTLLTVNGNLKFLNWVSVAGIVSNIGFNFIFIPKYGALGATYTSLVTQSVVAISQFFYVYKHFNFQFNSNLFLKYLFLILILIGIALVHQIFKLNFLASISMLTIGFIYVLAAKLFDWKSIPLLLKKE